MRRISTLDGPKLISRHRGLPVARKSVSALRDMHVAQRFDDFEFDDDLILDHQVGGILANDHVVVKDHDAPLLDDTEPGLCISWARAFS